MCKQLGQACCGGGAGGGCSCGSPAECMVRGLDKYLRSRSAIEFHTLGLGLLRLTKTFHSRSAIEFHTLGLGLLRLTETFHSRSAIEFHTFARLEALPMYAIQGHASRMAPYRLILQILSPH
jgi:hypothetical protein